MSPVSLRSARTVVLGLTALALPVLAAPAVAPAQAADRVDVAAASTIVIDGKGYGHGRGMSQYGAQGAARQGLDHRRIAEFYYPGTTWGTVKGQVKVRLTAHTSSNLVVLNRSHLRVRDLGVKKLWSLPDNGATRWRLKTDAKNRAVVQFKKGKQSWKRWKVLSGAEGEFGAAGRPITLVTPAGNVAYRGRLRAAAPSPGSRTREAVNLVSMENYLRGVVPLEIPASWHPEAVRAQAIAARTYATYERSHPLARHYQICDTTQCQVYGGASAEHPLSDAAIKATARSILTYGGKPAFTQFSSSNGGWTAAGTMPYQVAKADPYDGWAGNPVHDWRVKVGPAAFEKAWPVLGKLKSVEVISRTGQGQYGGRVLKARLVGTKRNVTVTGDQVRLALGLRSNWFDLTVVTPRKKTAVSSVR